MIVEPLWLGDTVVPVGRSHCSLALFVETKSSYINMSFNKTLLTEKAFHVHYQSSRLVLLKNVVAVGCKTDT